MTEPLLVLVASKDGREPGGLEHLGEHRLLLDTSAGWGAAANALLKQAAAAGSDALFCDDDVVFTPTSLDGVRAHYDAADIFGLDLHTLDGIRQAGARHTWDGQQISDWVEAGPAYVAHVTASAMYLKASALALRFPSWPGLYYEDVALCFDAWIKGLKVLAVPGVVRHDIENGSGATKRHTPEFWAKFEKNRSRFFSWCEKHDLSKVPQDAQPPRETKRARRTEEAS